MPNFYHFMCLWSFFSVPTAHTRKSYSLYQFIVCVKLSDIVAIENPANNISD